MNKKTFILILSTEMQSLCALFLSTNQNLFFAMEQNKTLAFIFAVKMCLI